ncbi:MAG TPA: hypothetical protein VFJ51_12905 [Nitrososphaeraceae archaeon]|nr:hypothetical protein [Nitrososphaeraceae archaeon]
MVKIAVNTLSPASDDIWVLHVEVTESDGSGSQTTHKVTIDKEYYEKISNGIVGPEDFVKKSFQFLLKRENKDSILREFNVNQIRQYFPEYENEIKQML